MSATFDKPELPKQELLLKLLNMTTSTTDGEALSAIRKANDLLKANKWDWEKLLRGKITVIADPFAGAAIPDPSKQPVDSWMKTTVPPRPAPQPAQPTWTPPPRPQTPPPQPQKQPSPAWQARKTAQAKSFVAAAKKAARKADLNQL